MRAAAAVGRVEGYPGEESLGTGYSGDATLGLGPVEVTGGGRLGGSLAADSYGKRTLIVWAAAAVWLVIVWRAVEGY